MKVQYQKNARKMFELETKTENGKVEVVPRVLTQHRMYEFLHHRWYGLYIERDIL